MSGQQWKIYWNEQAADTYLYGSQIQMHSKSNVHFENSMMPPGTIIKTWYSKTNFQKQHVEPALPIIDGETEYEISLDMEYPKGGECILRLQFFDKYEEDAGFFVVRNQPVRFRCPLKTYSYQAQLMNAGTTDFYFHCITIKEVTDNE